MNKPTVHFTDDTSMLGWLRAERERQGLSAQEMADDAGIFVTTLFHIEDGWRRPTIFFLSAMAGALGYRLNVEFVPKEDEPRAPD